MWGGKGEGEEEGGRGAGPRTADCSLWVKSTSQQARWARLMSAEQALRGWRWFAGMQPQSESKSDGEDDEDEEEEEEETKLLVERPVNILANVQYMVPASLGLAVG